MVTTGTLLIICLLHLGELELGDYRQVKGNRSYFVRCWVVKFETFVSYLANEFIYSVGREFIC